jgi:hypothetical protein
VLIHSFIISNETRFSLLPTSRLEAVFSAAEGEPLLALFGDDFREPFGEF